MLRGITLLVILAGILLLAGCGAAQENAQNTAYESAQMSSGRSTGEEDAGSDDVSSTSYKARDNGTAFYGNEVIESKVIKNAELTLSVKDLPGTIKKIEEKARQAGGVVAESQVVAYKDNRHGGFVNVRIPGPKFYNFLNEVEKLGEVENKRTYTNDVTKEYIDLNSRIVNLERQEKRLREMLDGAQKVEDILKIEKELERVRGELENLKGELRYLQNKIDFSTIKINLKEIWPPKTQLATGWRDIGSRSLQAFLNNFNMLVRFTANSFVFVFGALPILLPLAAIAFIVWYLKYGKWRPPRDEE